MTLVCCNNTELTGANFTLRVFQSCNLSSLTSCSSKRVDGPTRKCDVAYGQWVWLCVDDHVRKFYTDQRNRCSSGMLSTVDLQLVTDVSGQQSVQVRYQQAVPKHRTLTTNIREVTCQKSADLIYTAGKPVNHAECTACSCQYVIGLFYYISNKMQFYTDYLYLETALHVSGGTSTHHQERKQLYLQHLVFVTPLLLPAASNVIQFILSGNSSTCFVWYHHPSSGAQTTVSTTSGICHTVTATCR
jgi:hypothetical protein